MYRSGEYWAQNAREEIAEAGADAGAAAGAAAGAGAAAAGGGGAPVVTTVNDKNKAPKKYVQKIKIFVILKYNSSFSIAFIKLFKLDVPHESTLTLMSSKT